MSTGARLKLTSRTVSHVTVQDQFESVFRKKEMAVPSALGHDRFWLSFHASKEDGFAESSDAKLASETDHRSDMMSMHCHCEVIRDERFTDIASGESKIGSLLFEPTPKELRITEEIKSDDLSVDQDWSAEYMSPLQIKVKYESIGIKGCVVSAPLKKLPPLHPPLKGHSSTLVTQCMDSAMSSQMKVPLIVSGSRKGELSVCNARSNEILWRTPFFDKDRLQRGSADVSCVGFFPRGDLICTGDSSGTLHIYAVSQGDEKRVKPAVDIGSSSSESERHMGDVTALSFMNEGSSIVSGSSDGTVRIWDAATQKAVRCFGSLSTDRINQVVCSSLFNLDIPSGLLDDIPDSEWLGHSVVTVSDSGYLRIWDVRCRKIASEVLITDSAGLSDVIVLGSTLLPQPTLAVSTLSGRVCLIDSRRLDSLKELVSVDRDHSSPVIRLLSDQNGILACNADGMAWKWSLLDSAEPTTDLFSRIHTSQHFSGHSRFGISDMSLLDSSLFISDRNGDCFLHSVV